MKSVALTEDTLQDALGVKYNEFCPDGFRGTIAGANWDIYGFLKYKNDGKCTFHKDLKTSSNDTLMCKAGSPLAARICYCGTPPILPTPKPTSFVSGWHQ